MKLSDLKPTPGAVRKRRRVGRGIATGQGKTCGRGQKGQRARGRVPVGFEGGQTPLYQRIPKQPGRTNKAMNIGIFRRRYAVVNVGQLARFAPGADISPEILKEAGVVKDLKDGLKVLGEGDLDRALTVRAHAFSASAREKIEKAGGTVEVI
ncbi:MAG: 50S ribosomal protein L15 [Armatimonadota bacterium]